MIRLHHKAVWVARKGENQNPKAHIVVHWVMAGVKKHSASRESISQKRAHGQSKFFGGREGKDFGGGAVSEQPEIQK